MTLPDISSMSLMTGVGITAVIAAIGGFWSQAKGFMRYITGFVVLQKNVSHNMAYHVGRHVRKHYRKAPSGLGNYRALVMQVDDDTMVSLVPFHMPTQTSIWFGKRGAFLVSSSQGDFNIVSLRGISDPDGLIIDALMQARAERSQETRDTSGNFYVRRIMGSAGDPTAGYRNQQAATNSNAPISRGGGTSDEPLSDNLSSFNNPDSFIDKSFMYDKERYLKADKKRDPFQGLFFESDVKGLMDDMKNWYRREDWYRSHGIPWRMGALLHGPGGTGKSSLAAAAAETLGLPLYQYYLNTLTDREFVREWDDMQVPCVVALEDFDTVFHGRESVTVHRSLSFECVLNQISGIRSVNGVMLIVTTNKIEHIDSALGQMDVNGRPTRPGRIDRILHMGNTSLKQRQEIAHYVLDGWAEDVIDKMVNEGVDTTAAQFQSICISAALELLRENERLVNAK